MTVVVVVKVYPHSKERRTKLCVKKKTQPQSRIMTEIHNQTEAQTDIGMNMSIACGKEIVSHVSIT